MPASSPEGAALKIFDTQRHAKREFVPREAGKVAMYVCGPTVYDQIHIGNGRTFVAFDAIRRYLEAKGYDVTFVQNLTDVDDKIINRANEEGRSAAEVAAEYSDAFLEQMRRMGVEPPSVQPRATREIGAMQELLEELIAKEPYPAPRFVMDPSVTDFYAFTPDSFKLEGYQAHPVPGKIPVAV